MTYVIRGLVGGACGVVVGLALYKFVGCRTGACPLTGNPYIAAIIWGLMGVLLATGK